MSLFDMTTRTFGAASSYERCAALVRARGLKGDAEIADLLQGLLTDVLPESIARMESVCVALEGE